MMMFWKTQAFTLNEHRLIARNASGPEDMKFQKIEAPETAGKEPELHEDAGAAQSAAKERADTAQQKVETNVKKLQKNLDATRAAGAMVDQGDAALGSVKDAFDWVSQRAHEIGGDAKPGSTTRGVSDFVRDSARSGSDMMEGARTQTKATKDSIDARARELEKELGTEKAKELQGVLQKFGEALGRLNTAQDVGTAGAAVQEMNKALEGRSQEEINSLIGSMSFNMAPLSIGGVMLKLKFDGRQFSLESAPVVSSNASELSPDAIDAFTAQFNEILKTMKSVTTAAEVTPLVDQINSLISGLSIEHRDNAVRNIAMIMTPLELKDGVVRLIYNNGVFSLEAAAPSTPSEKPQEITDAQQKLDAGTARLEAAKTVVEAQAAIVDMNAALAGKQPAQINAIVSGRTWMANRTIEGKTMQLSRAGATFTLDELKTPSATPTPAPTEKPAEKAPEAPIMTKEEANKILSSPEFAEAMKPINAQWQKVLTALEALVATHANSPLNAGTANQLTSEITSNPAFRELVTTIEGLINGLDQNYKTAIQTGDLPAEYKWVGDVMTYLKNQAASTEKAPEAKNASKPAEQGDQSFDRNERIKKIDEEVASIDRDLAETDPAPSEERKQELLQDKKKLLETKKELQALPEEVPKTNADRLGKQIDEGFTELENAKTAGEKWAAIMKILATIGEFFQHIKDGTLGKAPDAPATGDKPKETNGETALGNKLDSELKDRAEKTKETDPSKNREGLKQEKLEKIKKNNDTLKTLDADVERSKDNKKASLKEKMRIETLITDLGTDESKAAEVASLKEQLKMIDAQIKAAEDAITAIDKQRDELQKANKQLEDEVAALEGREVGIGMLEKVLGRLNALLKEKGFTFTTKIEQTDGKFFIVIEGLTVEQAKLIDPRATSGTLRLDPLNLPASLGGKPAETPSEKNAATPVENKDVPVSVNELQQRRTRAIQNQSDALLKDDLAIYKIGEGTVYSGVEFGADYYNSDDFRIRYDSASRQWQIRKEEAKQWETPSQYLANDKENKQAVQRLANFNSELASLDAQIVDAQKREQIA